MMRHSREEDCRARHDQLREVERQHRARSNATHSQEAYQIRFVMLDNHVFARSSRARVTGITNFFDGGVTVVTRAARSAAGK